MANNSLVHKGEVLSLAELSADGHKRHICVIRINTEMLERGRKMIQLEENDTSLNKQSFRHPVNPYEHLKSTTA